MASVCRLNRRHVRQCSITGIAVAVVMICVLLFHVHPSLYDGGASDIEGLRDSYPSSSPKRATHETEMIGRVEEIGGNTESAVNTLLLHTTAQHDRYTPQQLKTMQKKETEGELA